MLVGLKNFVAKLGIARPACALLDPLETNGVENVVVVGVGEVRLEDLLRQFIDKGGLALQEIMRLLAKATLGCALNEQFGRRVAPLCHLRQQSLNLLFVCDLPKPTATKMPKGHLRVRTLALGPKVAEQITKGRIDISVGEQALVAAAHMCESKEQEQRFVWSTLVAPSPDFE